MKMFIKVKRTHNLYTQSLLDFIFIFDVLVIFSLELLKLDYKNLHMYAVIFIV